MDQMWAGGDWRFAFQMKDFRFSTAKNAFSNLVRGGATAVVAIILPRFLTRLLDTEHFSAWSLTLQITAYASYLDFGLQLAVARFIAQAAELEQKERQSKLVSTALLLLSLAAVIAFVLIAIIVWFFPHLFHGVSRGLLSDFRSASLVLAFCACLLLPLSTYTGVLIGMRRNEIPALAIGGSRIIGAAAAVIAAHFTQSLTVLGFCVGVTNLLGGLMQWVAVRKLIAHGRAGFRHVSRVLGRELLHFCTGLAVWSLAMLLVSGLDVIIVGHFQFAAVGYYALATMLISFFAGVTNAALSALLAPVSALHARGDTPGMIRVVFQATHLTVMVNLVMTSAIFLWGEAMLRTWVGPVYGASTLPILKVLAIAQSLRLTFAPYSVMLVSIGEQNRNIFGAVSEAAVNFCASILGIALLGPIGVAWGTLAGAFCGALWVVLRTMPSVEDVRIHFKDFMIHAVLPGSIPCLPLMLLSFIKNSLTPLSLETGLGISVCAAVLLGGWCMKRSFGRMQIRSIV